MKISVVIPAYNEENHIFSTINKILQYLEQNYFQHEIIVVDNGSTDNTFVLLEKTFGSDRRIKIKRLNLNMGKGYAVKTGVLEAYGEIIYFTDADLSTPIEEMSKMVKIMQTGGYDIVIGSRAVKGAKILVHQPFYREYLGKLFNKIVKLLLSLNFNDTQCGAKLFKKDVAKKIFSLSKINGFAFDVEILYIAKLFGYKIKEIPIVWRHFKDSKVRLLYDGIKMLIDVVRIRFTQYKNI